MAPKTKPPGSPGPFGFTGREMALLSIIIILAIALPALWFSFSRDGQNTAPSTVVKIEQTDTPAQTRTLTSTFTVIPETPIPSLTATTPNIVETPLTPTIASLQTATVTSTHTATPSPETPPESPTVTPTLMTPTFTPTPTLTPTLIPQPQPRAATIIYVQTTNQGDHSLAMARSSGAKVDNFFLRDAAAPAWSPDGSKIAFFREPGAPQVEGVYLVDSTGDNITPLVPGVDHIRNIAWSPDGTKLAYEFTPPGIPAEVIVVDAQNGQEFGKFNGEQPAWSPNGQKLIAKACLPDCGLWRFAFNGAQEAQITFNGTDSFPFWSRNGQYMAFSSNRDDNWEIYLQQMASYSPQGRPIRLTHRPASDIAPVFSPDSLTIYLITDHYGAWWVTRINLNGQNERKIVEGIGLGSDWSLSRVAVR